MSLIDLTPYNEYDGDGVLLSFLITFPFFANAHLYVRIVDTTTGLETELTEGIGYSVTGGDPGTGITIIGTPPSVTEQVRIDRRTPRTQADTLGTNQMYLTQVLEANLDKITMEIQELGVISDRSVRFPLSVDPVEFDTVLPTDLLGTSGAECVLAVNATGDGFMKGPTVTDITTAVTAVADAVAAALAAAASAAAAASSAGTASTAASNAAASALAAATSESNAANSEVAAAASESNAQISEVNAAASDAAAAASALAAATSESNAAASANAASTSESNAGDSEAAAAISEANAAASEAAAAISETNAAASAAAAAASALSVGPEIVGSRAAPTAVVAANGILVSSVKYNIINFIEGSGGPITITAAARIQAGTLVGQRITLIGRSDTNYVTMADGNGIITGGMTLRLSANSMAVFVWDSVNWVLESSNGLV